MSLYLANQTNATSPVFITHGIQNLGPSEPGEVMVTASCGSLKVSQNIINCRFLAARAKSQLENYVISSSEVKYYNIVKRFKDEISFEVPIGRFQFNNLTDENKASLRGIGLNEEPGRKNLFLGSPNFNNLGLILTLQYEDTRYSPGEVNGDAYLAYVAAIRCLGVFSWSSRASMNESGNTVCQSKGAEAVMNGVNELQVTRMGGVEKALYKPPGTGATICFAADFLGQVYYPEDPSKRIRPCNSSKLSLPDGFIGEGHFFHYFEGLNQPDKSFLSSTFFDHFFELLGDTYETCSDMWRIIRPGLRALAATRAGRALGHAFVGVRLAAKSGAVFHTVISEGVYHGFFLQGEGLHVTLRNANYPAKIWNDVMVLPASLDLHSTSLARFIALINDENIVNGRPEISMTMVDSSVKMRKFIASNRAQIMANKDLVMLFHKGIGYPEKFPPICNDTILDFLRFVQTGSFEHIDKYPAYLRNAFLVNNGNRVAEGLSIFGDRAPSLSWGSDSDRKFSLPTSSSGSDPNLEIGQVDKKRNLQFLPFKAVPIQTAYSQWLTLFNKGEIRLPKGNAKAFVPMKHVAFSVSNDPYFTEMYLLVKNRSIVVREGLKQGSRKRGADEGEQGERVRQKKAKSAIASEWN